jgi:hypothetical protein
MNRSQRITDERARRVVLVDDSAAMSCETCGGPGPLVVFDTGDYVRPCKACLQYALELLGGGAPDAG